MKEIIFLSVICVLTILTGADERHEQTEQIQVQSRASGAVPKDASIPQKYKSHKIKENVNKPTEPPQQMQDMDQMQQMQQNQQMQQMQKMQQTPPKKEPVDDVDDEDEVDDDDDEDDDLVKPEPNKEQTLEREEESNVSDRNRIGDMNPTSDLSPMSDVDPISDVSPMTDMSDLNDMTDMSDDMSQDFLAAGNNFQNMAALTPANPNLIYSSGINAKHVIGYIPITTSNGQALIFPAGAVRIVQPAEAVDFEDDFIERAVQRQNNVKRNKRKKNQRRKSSYQVYRRPENYYWQRRWPMASYGRRPTNSKGKRYGNGKRRNMYRNFYDY